MQKLYQLNKKKIRKRNKNKNKTKFKYNLKNLLYKIIKTRTKLKTKY